MEAFDTHGAHAPDSMVAGLTARWHDSLDTIAAPAWDALLDGVPGARPFLTHNWLKALTDHGCAAPDTGWQPLYLTLEDPDGRLWAACPLYLKAHSYGEYVFDWSWADAHDRALAAQGHRYYPKLVSAVPFSPIPGQRLLTAPGATEARCHALRARLLAAVRARCTQEGWSGAHLLFLSEAEAGQACQAGWLVRHGVQFHWLNRSPAPYADFDDFLSSLHRDKRKKIQQERRKVREAGVSFSVLEGQCIRPQDWAFFYGCYARTYLEHGQHPYLSRDFWMAVGANAPEHWVMFVAEMHGEPVAASLVALDHQTGTAYGRYWGSMAQVSCLHFEACYYQPLAWCIARGMARFEGGAQGEHKLARGLLPVGTRSAHWLAHDGLRTAVADFLGREDAGLSHYVNELNDRMPFKPQD